MYLHGQFSDIKFVFENLVIRARRFVPRDVLSLGMFCPWDLTVLRVCLGTFCMCTHFATYSLNETNKKIVTIILSSGLDPHTLKPGSDPGCTNFFVCFVLKRRPTNIFKNVMANFDMFRNNNMLHNFEFFTQNRYLYSSRMSSLR